MVFYFSGTGNSHAVALELCRIAEGGDESGLIDITECMKEGRLRFSPDREVPIVIVCPVYFGGLPSIVRDFIAGAEWNPAPGYICGVLTYGGKAMDAGGMLRDDLKKRELDVSAVFSVRMPANYCVLYEPPGDEEVHEILECAGSRIVDIGEAILEKRHIPYAVDGREAEMSAKFYPKYEDARKTAPFWVDDQCISCGVCAGRCPVGAIEMIDGTPTWVKDKCVHCMSCARCGAIQYGDSTVGRRRYRHPIYGKKAEKNCH